MPVGLTTSPTYIYPQRPPPTRSHYFRVDSSSHPFRHGCGACTSNPASCSRCSSWICRVASRCPQPGFLRKIDLLSNGSLTPLDIFLYFWFFRTVTASALGSVLRDFLPPIGGWRGFVHTTYDATAYPLRVL